MKTEKIDNLSIVFISYQRGGLTNIDRYLMSCQAFIFPLHEHQRKLEAEMCIITKQFPYSRYMELLLYILLDEKEIVVWDCEF